MTAPNTQISGAQASNIVITALVLAGKRDGAVDPLAQKHGTTHKCLVPIAGRPLIAHVLAALAAAPQVDRIIVSIDDVAALSGLDDVDALVAEGRLLIIPSRDNLADSVTDAGVLADFPLLITTADNVLFTPDAVTRMIEGAQSSGADVAAAFARREDVLAAHPDGQRRFYTFSDDGYSNCNCYWIGDRRFLTASGIFREGGQFSKHPMRIVKVFGLINLIRFRLGIGTVEQSFERFSRRLGMTLRPILFADGRLAIDVDNERTYGVAEQLLNAREEEAEPTGLRQVA
jgi:GTP:adenosylcobinamide-phosphate guanylyltransferase